MKSRIYPFLLLSMAVALRLSAQPQPVVFTNQNSLLSPITGFANYSDCAVDMNGDYLDDVVRVGGKGLHIDFQQPDGTFRQRFFNLPVLSPPNWSICAGDLDNNGFNDLLFAHGGSVSFVKANDSGTAYQETVMPVPIFSQRSTLADIDNDGWLDAFVCHDTAQSIPFRNDGAGNMSPDTNLIHTADRPGSYSAIWVDYDNDGDIDLYISKCEGAAPPSDPDRINLLYRNNGDGSFTEVAGQAGLNDHAQSWSTVFEDFDNDGDFDAFIVNHDFQNRLFRNNGNGTFTDVIAASGIAADDYSAFENSSGDFNNDGFMDIFSGLLQRLYLGHGDLTFSGQTAPVIPGAIADLNNDGFLDVVRKSQVWINEANGNHWLKINTLGLTGNRNGIGARLEIYGAWGRQTREVRSGQSYTPMNTLTTHFGLGPEEQIDSLIVKWPSGIMTTLRGLAADTTYLVPEAPCTLAASVLSVGDTSICPGATVQLTAPAGFAQYTWSNGNTGPTVTVGEEGRYSVVLRDSQGCVSLSNPVKVKFIKEVSPVITASSGNRFCAGDTLILTASPGENYVWSDGSTGVQNIAVTQPGNYTVAVDAICAATSIVSAPFPVTVLPAPAPVVSGVQIGPGDSVLLTATGENLEWYDQPAGGVLLDTGATFQTPPLASGTTYYVEAHHLYPGAIESGGKPDTSGVGGLPAQGGYLLFEVWEPFTLVSVTVYVPPGAPTGTRFVQLISADTFLSVAQFPVQTGVNVLQLNFAVPPGHFSLRSPQGNLFRNIPPLDYPYPLGTSGQITTSSLGDDYYFYFYDWKIRPADYECVSVRTPVEVMVMDTEEAAGVARWKLYPNPADGRVWVDLGASDAEWLRLVDMTGREVGRQDVSGRQLFALDLKGLVPGMYRFQVWGKEWLGERKLMLR